jgi:CRISPR/Cas system-associated exonuclease Cas4 (RecB family)
VHPVPSTRALIHAPWSASKVSTALRCPRLFHFKYIQKIKEPEVMAEARIGKSIHKALELVLQGTPETEAREKVRGELPNEHEQLRFDNLGQGIGPFASRIQQFKRRRRVARQLVEYSLAVREDLSTTQFYAGDAYYRGVLDLGYIFQDDSIALVDHKTGARIPGSSITDQLEGYAVLAASAFRHVRQFWLGIHWIAERAVEWSKPVRPEFVVDELVPDLLDNIEAAALAVSDGPRANPGTYCDRCSYRELCPASKELRYEPVEYYEDDED